MKNAFAFFLPMAFLLAACSNVDTHRAAIESLNSEWENTTGSVMAFANSLQQEQLQFNQTLSSVLPGEEAIAKVNDDERNKLLDAFNSLQGSGDQFGAISNELNTFVSEWSEKAAEVTALTDGLAAGNLPKDVVTQISALSAYAANAQTQLSGWQEQLDAARNSIASEKDAFQNVVAEVLPNK
jgi:hypothetical protein